MPGHDPGSPLHRCHLAPHPGPSHSSPVTLDPGSALAGLAVSWIDPLPPPEDYA